MFIINLKKKNISQISLYGLSINCLFLNNKYSANFAIGKKIMIFEISACIHFKVV